MVIVNSLRALFRCIEGCKTHETPYLICTAQNIVVSKADLHQRLNSAYEITLSVKGRKSGRDIPRPVWFTYEGNTLHLLPNYGSDTNWYKNF
jgi:hypothetical protein